MKRMVGREEILLPVQDRRIFGRPVIALAQPERLQVNSQGFSQCRVRIGLEPGIRKVGNHWFSGVKLDDVGVLHAADVAPGAALVEPEQRRETIQGAFVDVDRGRRAFADS